MGKLAHGLKAVFRASFDDVVRALSRSQRASGVYLEVLNTEPRVAIAVGDKYFFRAGNYLMATTVAVDLGNRVEVKVVAGGGKEGLFDFFDWGASKKYAHEVIEDLSRFLGLKPESVVDVDYLDVSRSSLLRTELP